MARTSPRPGMWGRPGDRIVIHHHHVGDKDRDGEILEALGDGDGPPFVVRWSDDGHVSRFYPGSDAYVEHLAPGRSARTVGSSP